MSSLPTLDGFNHPSHSSGQSPEIGSPTSLARSVSASVCPIKPSDPDSIEPTAVKTLKASAELQINSKKKEHFPLQDHSDLASSADQSLDMPLHNSSEEAVIADNLEKSTERSTQGLKFYLHTRQEASLSVTSTRMHEPLMLIDERCRHPKSQNLSPVNGLQQHIEPGSEQHEVVQKNTPCDREHLCDMGDLELDEERHQDQQNIVDLEATMKGYGQKNMDLTSTEKCFLSSGCCSDSETLMEVDTLDQSLVAVLNSAGSLSASVKNTDALDLTSDNPSMEVETSKCNPSSENLSNAISTQDLQPPRSNIEMCGTNKEYGCSSPSLSLCGCSQPSVESAEEPCSSITAALKELHELLVISSKPASENTPEEVTCQSEIVADHQTGIKDLSERWTQSEHLTLDDECPQVSYHQTRLVSVKTENLGTTPCTDIEDVKNTSSRGSGDDLSADKEGVPRSRESVSKNSSGTITSAKSNQLHCPLGVENSPRPVAGEEDTLSQTSEQTKSLPSSFILVEDLGQGIHYPVTDRPETRENDCPAAARPFLELEPLTSQPSSIPSILPPLVFPATDIDRLVRAGFTLQEALGALRQVGGNADLALLVLLAKSIVVPT